VQGFPGARTILARGPCSPNDMQAPSVGQCRSFYRAQRLNGAVKCTKVSVGPSAIAQMSDRIVPHLVLVDLDPAATRPPPVVGALNCSKEPGHPLSRWPRGGVTKGRRHGGRW
jgi:hypothetical protein